MKKTNGTKRTKSLHRGKKLAKQTTLKPTASLPTEAVSMSYSSLGVSYQQQLRD